MGCFEAAFREGVDLAPGMSFAPFFFLDQLARGFTGTDISLSSDFSRVKSTQSTLISPTRQSGVSGFETVSGCMAMMME